MFNFESAELLFRRPVSSWKRTIGKKVPSSTGELGKKAGLFIVSKEPFALVHAGSFFLMAVGIA